MSDTFKLHEMHRATRSVPVAHAEAFQLMLYRDEKGTSADMWVWNSRDGVTPFGTRTHRHAMGDYLPSYSAILPDQASHVWVDYDRAAWEAMNRDKFERFAAGDDEYGADFRQRYPTIEDWLAVAPFEHGQPRLVTRQQFFAETPSYAGRWDGKSEAHC